MNLLISEIHESKESASVRQRSSKTSRDQDLEEQPLIIIEGARRVQNPDGVNFAGEKSWWRVVERKSERIARLAIGRLWGRRKLLPTARSSHLLDNPWRRCANSLFQTAPDYDSVMHAQGAYCPFFKL